VWRGRFRVVGTTVVVGALLGFVLAGCGSSSPKLSSHDQAALKRIGALLATFRGLEAQISADTIAGSRVSSRSQYIRIERPRIEQLGSTAQQLRHEVSSLDDSKITGLYAPLADAVDKEANDLTLFLNASTLAV
jgi:hypothetical protein